MNRRLPRGKASGHGGTAEQKREGKRNEQSGLPRVSPRSNGKPYPNAVPGSRAANRPTGCRCMGWRVRVPGGWFVTFRDRKTAMRGRKRGAGLPVRVLLP